MKVKTLFKKKRGREYCLKCDNLQIAGIYKISCKNNKNYEIVYVGMTKRKIEERLKEHIRDLKNYNQTAALERANIENPIKINKILIET